MGEKAQPTDEVRLMLGLGGGQMVGMLGVWIQGLILLVHVHVLFCVLLALPKLILVSLPALCTGCCAGSPLRTRRRPAAC